MKRNVTAGDWTAALRSGLYQQGFRALRDTDDKMCCLGVLCDLVDPDAWDLKPAANTYEWGDKVRPASVPSSAPADAMPPVEQMPDWFRDRGTDAHFGPGISYTFTKLNDRMGWTFEQIADWIDAGMDGDAAKRADFKARFPDED